MLTEEPSRDAFLILTIDKTVLSEELSLREGGCNVGGALPTSIGGWNCVLICISCWSDALFCIGACVEILLISDTWGTVLFNIKGGAGGIFPTRAGGEGEALLSNIGGGGGTGTVLLMYDAWVDILLNLVDGGATGTLGAILLGRPRVIVTKGEVGVTGALLTKTGVAPTGLEGAVGDVGALVYATETFGGDLLPISLSGKSAVPLDDCAAGALVNFDGGAGGTLPLLNGFGEVREGFGEVRVLADIDCDAADFDIAAEPKGVLN